MGQARRSTNLYKISTFHLENFANILLIRRFHHFCAIIYYLASVRSLFEIWNEMSTLKNVSVLDFSLKTLQNKFVWPGASTIFVCKFVILRFLIRRSWIWYQRLYFRHLNLYTKTRFKTFDTLFFTNFFVFRLFVKNYLHTYLHHLSYFLLVWDFVSLFLLVFPVFLRQWLKIVFYSFLPLFKVNSIGLTIDAMSHVYTCRGYSMSFQVIL